jgi:hypothetical protein
MKESRPVNRKLSAPTKLKISFSDTVSVIESPTLSNKSLSSRTSPSKNLYDIQEKEDEVKSPKKKDSIQNMVRKIIRSTSKKLLDVQINHNNEAIQEETLDVYSSPKPKNSRRLGSRFERVDVINDEDLKKEEDGIDERAKWDWGINIWNNDSNDKYIKFTPSDNGDIVAGGSFNELVKYLTSGLDVEYTNTFLLTYKSFAPPRILLKKLLERYKCDGCDEENIPLIQTKCIGVLVNWLEDYFKDFNPLMVRVIQEFITYIRQENKIIGDKLDQVLVNQMVGLCICPNLQFEKHPPPSKLPKDMKKINILTLDSKEVARQLTLQDWEYFEALKPVEFLNKAWSHPILKERAGNVLKMISRFNSISKWAIYSILNYPVLKKRAKAYTKFVEIAYELYQMNNFNGAVAIFSGLNNAAIYRLKQTKEKASSNITLTKYNALEALIDSNHSYKTYREALTNSSPPCIPHLGVYLQDLTFIEDGNEDMLEENLINFTKRRMIYKSILSIRQFQQSPYNFYSVDAIQDHLCLAIDNSSSVSDDDMFNISRKIEPKELKGSIA